MFAPLEKEGKEGKEGKPNCKEFRTRHTKEGARAKSSLLRDLCELTQGTTYLR